MKRLMFEGWFVYTIVSQNHGKIKCLSLGFLGEAQLFQPQSIASATVEVMTD